MAPKEFHLESESRELIDANLQSVGYLVQEKNCIQHKKIECLLAT